MRKQSFLNIIAKYRDFFATTWINLQDAYTVESNNVGSWTQIGYNAPGTKDAASSAHTTNFGYTDAVSGQTATWKATAKVKLNDCAVNGYWQAVATAEKQADADGGMTYVKIQTSGTSECIGLTPSFSNLARASAQ